MNNHPAAVPGHSIGIAPQEFGRPLHVATSLDDLMKVAFCRPRELTSKPNVAMTILPPGPAPTQVTVRTTSHNLREHLQGFLCANNAHGFLAEVDLLDNNPLMLMLLEEAEREESSLDNVKRTAWRIKKLACGQVKHGNCLEVLAAVYGYRTYSSMKATADARGRIVRKQP